MIKLVSNSTSQTEEIAEKLGRSLKSSVVIAYFGGLAMGKTAFTRGLARGMGLDDDVSSPTFAIVNDYGGKLAHFDMYRVETFEDLHTSGFFDYLDMGYVLAVEWSENIENALDDDIIRITFERTEENENQRIITIEGYDNENFSD
ncbi:MAG: tRNA (adenosine(37)-N6)-threonylcarbamoyltransferase complex ATPase subunit type 1 TsaE [Clostridia bacterium]